MVIGNWFDHDNCVVKIWYPDRPKINSAKPELSPFFPPPQVAANITVRWVHQAEMTPQLTLRHALL